MAAPDRSRVSRLAAAVVVLLALPAAAQPPPDEAWRTLATKHFRVTFPAHLEDLGRNAADVAERAYRVLSTQFLAAPAGPIDLLLTDHLDVSNGSAQVRPSNRITVYARPPADHLALAYFDDWMELVVIHELAHVIHLDRSGLLGRALRGVFGRLWTGWPFFPGYAVPGWVIEGIATWYESALTGAGRVHGTFYEMVLRTAALEDRFETIGQAGGNSPVWPSGIRRYAYGSRFLDYLLDRHGPDRVAAFVEAVAGQWAPYRLDAAGEQAFGVRLSTEWTAWADAARAAAQTQAADATPYGPITAPETLTSEARQGLHPQVSPDGRALIYVRSDGRSDPRLVTARPDGRDTSTVTRINHVTAFDVSPSGEVVFAQRDFTDRYRIFSDLYIAAPNGPVRRVTTGARLSAPSVGPDGTWAVAVAEGGGTNALVQVDLRDGSTEPLAAASPGTYWADPAVSPDGKWIAATRWTAGRHDIVILDAAGRLVHEVTRDRALDLAPDWDAVGRHLVWASDRTGILNVLGAEVDPLTGAAGPPILLTNVRTGAAFPSVDPANRWLYFSGYHADGWEVERIRFLPDSAAPARDPESRFSSAAAAAAPPAAAGPVRGYSPWPTLAPTWWSPVLREPLATAPARTADGVIPRQELLGYAIGARTSAMDLVGRHAYEAGAQVFTSGGRAEGHLSYEYRRLGNPTLGLNVSQFWNAGGVTLGRPPEGADAAPEPLFVLERERRLATSVTMRRPTMRSTVALTVSGGVVLHDRELLDDTLQTTRRYQLAPPGATLAELALGLSVSTARTHDFQMGNARGVSLFVRARLRDDLHPADAAPGRSPDDRSSTDVIGRAAAYLPLPGRRFAAPVLALRAAIGVARGPGAGASHFNVGGAAGRTLAAGGFPRFGGPAVFFPVRGYETSTRSGRQAWTASVEYRTPLALLNRGAGAWPLHVDRIFGSLFVDAGDAWGSSAAPSGVHRADARVLTSAGVEITTDLLALYAFPLRVRVGAAFPLVESAGTVAYVRLGVPF